MTRTPRNGRLPGYEYAFSRVWGFLLRVGVPESSDHGVQSGGEPLVVVVEGGGVGWLFIGSGWGADVGEHETCGKTTVIEPVCTECVSGYRGTTCAPVDGPDAAGGRSVLPADLQHAH